MNKLKMQTMPIKFELSNDDEQRKIKVRFAIENARRELEQAKRRAALKKKMAA